MPKTRNLWPILVLLLAQTTPQGGPPLQTPPPQGPKNGVIQPPAQVDPAINKPTPAPGTFPTPVVHPPQQPPKAQ
jgi:hypothetical protein